MIVSLRPHFVVAIVYFLLKGLTNLLASWCFASLISSTSLSECLRRESGRRPEAATRLPEASEPQKSQPVTDSWPILCAAYARSGREPIRLARTNQLQPPPQLPQIGWAQLGIE